MNAETLLAHLNLAPHPEGGFYRRYYAGSGNTPREALPCGFNGARLFRGNPFSASRGRLLASSPHPSRRVWHFCLRGPLRLALLGAHGPETAAREVLPGQNLPAGQRLQYAVPAGSWFGATPRAGSAFSLVGRTVAPGFGFADPKLGNHEKLLGAFLKASARIREFCPEENTVPCP